MGKKVEQLKKYFNWITVPFVVFALIIYAGNVLIIGEHLGHIVPTGIISTCIECIWDIGFITLPFILIGLCIYKTIYSFEEVQITNILREKKTEKLTAQLNRILSQEDTPECILKKYDYRETFLRAEKSKDRSRKQDALNKYYTRCKEEADIVTKKYALYAAASVVLSPKTAGDTLALMVWQIRTINTILHIYGGRPGIFATIRIYRKILFQAFMAGSIDEIFDQFVYGAVDGKTLSYLTQAVAAIATCLRTSQLTQYYLWNGTESDSKLALKEAVQKMPVEITKVITSREFKDVTFKSWKCCVGITKEAGKYLVSLIFNEGDDNDRAIEREGGNANTSDGFDSI